MLLTIFTAVVILGVLVLAHELGHFFTARIFKVKAEEFGLGLPPRLVGVYKTAEGKRKVIWGKKDKIEKTDGTVYSLNLIPVGGFVKIKGENGENKDEADSFGAKRIWQRAVMLVAGVLMNVLVCAALLTFGFSFGIPSIVDEETSVRAVSVKNEEIQIVSINKNSPAEAAGLKVGDVVLAIDGQKIGTVGEFQNYVASKENQMVNLEVLHRDLKIKLEIIPKILETSNGRAVLGIGLVKTGIITYPWYLSIWQGLKATYYLTIAILVALWNLLQDIILRGQVSAEIAGPVGIAVLTGQMVNLGIIYVLQFAALLSLNLALINILPFPALDGGRLLFLLIEKIRGKMVNQKIEAMVHNIGFIILMILVALVTYRDLVRWGGRILERVF